MIARFLDDGDTFHFACQMTGDCCRAYTIVCTPYDVVRLRHATHLRTGAMLAAGLYEIVDEPLSAAFGGEAVAGILAMFGAPARDLFPVARLRRTHDAIGPKCPMLRADNLCGAYEHRPGVCRSYPLGRVRTPEGPRWFEREYWCPGKEQGTQTVADWVVQSGLAAYAAGNDRFAAFADTVRAAGVDFAALPAVQQDALRAILYDFDTALDVRGRSDYDTLTAIDAAAHAWLGAVTAPAESSPARR